MEQFRAGVFTRDFLEMGPWKTREALKRAHRRGVLREGIHWDWLGGQRVYYPRRILPGCARPGAVVSAEKGGGGYDATATAEHLRRVLTDIAQR